MRNEALRASVPWLAPALILLFLLPMAVGQEESGERVRGYVPPPTELKKVDDHWTPYDPPAPPEGASVHIIVPGDTLWDLATTYYEDPYLWPIIWDANRYVTYSHWIYPGDPLVVPPKPTVVGEAGVEEPPPPAPEPPAPPPRATMEEAYEEAEPEPEPVKPAGPVLVPAAELQEMICSAQLLERFDPAPLSIMGAEEPEKMIHGPADILYLSAGLDMAIKPGAEYVIVRPGGVVHHPADEKQTVAVYLQRLGRVRVLAVHKTSSTVEIIDACDGVKVGDYLVPYHEMPVPMVERIPLNQLGTPYPGRLNGTVVVSHDMQATVAGAGEIVGIDLGSRAGLTAGDRILFWREGPGGHGPGGENIAPRRILAQGVVLVTNAGGSMVKILESKVEIALGDRAEVL